MSYVLICKYMQNIKYNMMSQWLKETLKEYTYFEETKNKTYKIIPEQIDNCHQHKYHI